MKTRKTINMAALITLALFLPVSEAKAQPQPQQVEQAAPHQAQTGAPSMDRAAIEQFYQISVAAQIAGADETVVFLKKHAHEKLAVSMKVISRIPGAPQAQTEEWTLDKRQLILKTKEAAQSSRVQSLKTKLLSVQLSEDGHRAKVKDTSFGVSLVRVPSPEGGVMLMKAEQSMLCDDELVMTPAGLIQFEKSHCNVEVVFNEKK